jgi:hypothetical protein
MNGGVWRHFRHRITLRIGRETPSRVHELFRHKKFNRKFQRIPKSHFVPPIVTSAMGLASQKLARWLLSRKTRIV